MKILIVNCFATTRSVGKITTLQYQYFKSKGHDVKVCYRGFHEPKVDNKDYISIATDVEVVLGRAVAQITGYEGYTHPFATRKLIAFTKNFNPDIVQINLIHGYYLNGNQYLTFLKENDYPVCYTMMDEYAYMGKCPFSFECAQFYDGCKGGCPNLRNYPVSKFFDRSKFIWEGKKKAYGGFKRIVFTGPGWVVNRAKKSALLNSFRIEELDEPVNFGDIFYPRETTALRQKLNIPAGNKIIVTVSQLSDPRKGGRYVFDVAKRLESHKNITFVFVGCDVPAPIETNNVIKIPYVKCQNELSEFYSLGDLFVCTSLADTMPNVCIDALGCGTPLAGFAEAGTPYVASKEFGIFTPTYDIEKLANVIINTPIKNSSRIEACRNYAIGRYSPEVVFEKQEQIYDSLLNM